MSHARTWHYLAPVADSRVLAESGASACKICIGKYPKNRLIVRKPTWKPLFGL